MLHAKPHENPHHDTLGTGLHVEIIAGHFEGVCAVGIGSNQQKHLRAADLALAFTTA